MRSHIKCLLLFISILLFQTTVVAQQSLEIKMPHIELGKADVLLLEALAADDSPLFVEAFSNKIYYQLLLSRDSIPTLIREVEQLAHSTTNLATQSMLYSLTASLYLAQYESNSYTYNQRTPTAGEYPDQITEWSGVDFFETIYRYIALSIAATDKLQQQPALPYRNAVARWGLSSCNTTTSLYEVVAQRAIQLLRELPTVGVANYLPQRSFDAETLLASREMFVTTDFSSYENQVAATILHLYQTLLLNSNCSAAIDLARVDYAYSIAKASHRYDLYLNALQQLIDTTKGSSEQVAVVAAYAKATLRSSSYEVLSRTLALCQDCIENYPSHPLQPQLEQYVEQLTAPTFTIDTSLPIYPERTIQLPFIYNNIGGLTIQLYRDTLPVPQTITQGCSDTLTLVPWEATLTLPPLPLGEYKLVVYPDTFTELAQSTTVHVTQFSTAIVGRAVVVTDSQSGKPQKGVNVLLYRDEKTVIDSLTTNKEGVVQLPHSPQLYGVKAMKGNDKYARITPTPYNYAKSNESNNKVIKQCALFTDRSLYRPDDTVAFTGICYQEGRVLPQQAVTLYLYDSTSQLLATQHTTTDMLGGFHGTFHLPEMGLQGGYYICNSERSAYARFEVASYKQPSFDVSLLPIDNLYAFDTPITQRGVVKGYAANQLSGATVRYTVTQKAIPYSHTRIEVASGEVAIDSQGEFAFLFTPTKGDNDKESYEVVATVTSLTGESVTATHSMVVATSPIALSVAMPSYVERTKRVPLAIQIGNYMHQPVVNRACEYRLYSLTDNKGEMIAEFAKGKLVSTARFDSSDIPATANWSKIPTGAYLLEVVVYDSNDPIASQECRFVLYSQKESRPPIYAPLWMPQTTFSCKQGNSVKVLVGSSDKDSYITYLLFDGYNLVESDYIKRSNRNKLLTIDYKESYGEELQLVVMRVREGKHQLIKGKIKRIEEEKRLAIRTESIRDYTTPGVGERWLFTVEQHNGVPVEGARFMATLFDASLLALNPHIWRFAPNDRYTNYTPVITWSRQSGQSCLSLLYKQPSSRDSNSTPEALIPTMDRVVVAYGAQTKSMVTGATSIQEVEKEDTPFAYRRNFNETAVFYSNLTTNGQGEVTMAFTLPDAATTWQLYCLAYTDQLAIGELQRTVVANRALLVKPYLPQFIREGDRVTLTAEVSNLSDTIQLGEVMLELYHPTTLATIATRVHPFTTLAGKSQTVQFEIDAPVGVELLGVRVRATSGSVSDGEEHLLAVLPNSRLVTETLPILLAGGDSKGVFTLDKLASDTSTTRSNYRLTLNYTAHPIWYAVQALPSLTFAPSHTALSAAHTLFAHTAAAAIVGANPLVSEALKEVSEYPLALDDNENLKSILLAQTPWVLEATTQREQLAQLATLLDSTATIHHRNRAMAELLQQQQSDGGWAWHNGMPSNPHITVEIVMLLAELKELGMTTYNETETQAQIAALRYLDNCLVEGDKNLWIDYLYLRSLYQDVPLGDALDSHKAMMERLAKQWHTLSLAEQAKAAQTLYRYGNRVLAHEVIDYLLAHATTTCEQGMFWANNLSEGTALQSAVLVALSEIDPENSAVSPIKQRLIWLKQTTHWGNPTATVKAVYALLYSGENWLLPPSVTATIMWGDTPLGVTESTLAGYIEESRQGGAITPAYATVTIEREATSQPAWGGLYWQYFEQYDRITTATQQPINLEKRLYVNNPNRGLTLITDTTHLHVGDRVEVQLALHTATALDFVHLQDERAAALLPTQQLAHYRYAEGVGYYHETTAAATNFYFDHLPKGDYLFSYTLVVDREGSYNNGIATLQCLYAPQMAAHTVGLGIDITACPQK